MHDVGSFASQKLVKFPPCVARPDRLFRHADLAQNVEVSNLVIATTVDDYVVSCELQHAPFLIEDDVLTARLLIGIVNHDDFHRSGCRASDCLLILLRQTSTYK